MIRRNHLVQRPVLCCISLLYRSLIIHPAGLRLLFLCEMLCKLALQRVFFFRCPVAAFRTLFGLRTEARLCLAVLPCVHLSSALVEVFRRLRALCKAHAVIEISVIIRSQLSTPCRILPLHIGQRVYHLILRGLHRTFPNWSFRQLKRRLQLAVELYKLLHLIALVVIRIRCLCRALVSRFSAQRARRTKHQAAERTARGALGQLRKGKLCVRIVCRLIRNVVEEIACAFLCRLLTHLDEDIFYGIHAAGVQNLAHLTERQSFGCRLNRTRGQTARQRLPRTLALLIQFKRALTGCLAAHHDRADRRTDDRNRTCRHHRRIARKGNALFGQPARRRR